MATGRQETWLKREDSGNRVGEWRQPSRREMSREELLEDWLGTERSASVFADLRALKTDVKGLVTEALSSVGQADMLMLTRLQEGWSEIVGVDNARFSQPFSFADGVLKVKVTNAALRFVFERQMKSAFLVKLKQQSNGAVTRLDFVF